MLGRLHHFWLGAVLQTSLSYGHEIIGRCLGSTAPGYHLSNLGGGVAAMRNQGQQRSRNTAVIALENTI
jgi:hypothetical protein